MNNSIIFLIIGAAIGAFFSWLFAKIYYEKVKKDSNKLIEKLNEYNEKILKILDDKKSITKEDIDKIFKEFMKDGVIDGGTF